METTKAKYQKVVLKIQEILVSRLSFLWYVKIVGIIYNFSIPAENLKVIPKIWFCYEIIGDLSTRPFEY